MDMEEAVKEIEALREALAERDEKISKFSEEAYANKAALDDANLKLAEMAKREFDSKLNDGIKCGKVGPKQRALFERLFQEKGHCGDLDEFLELTDEGAAHTAAFANLSGELGADVAGDAKSGLGLVKLYKGEKK